MGGMAFTSTLYKKQEWWVSDLYPSRNHSIQLLDTSAAYDMRSLQMIATGVLPGTHWTPNNYPKAVGHNGVYCLHLNIELIDQKGCLGFDLSRNNNQLMGASGSYCHEIFVSKSQWRSVVKPLLH